MSQLKDGWVVRNAVNRDVERQHLNKILKEIRAAVDAGGTTAGGGSASDIQSVVGRMVEGNTETGISVDYDAAARVLNFVVSNFLIRLSGDVSGQGEVNGLQSVTIPVTIDPSKVGIGDAPSDGLAYWRRDGAWQSVGTALDQLQYFSGGGIAVLDSDGEWHARTIQGTDGEIDVTNGDGVLDNPVLSLADVPDEGGGVLQNTTFDSKGRMVGSSEATTDDLTEGTYNLYFTEERARAAAVADLIDPLVTDVAPSQRAVAEALEAVVGVPGPPGKDGQIRFTGEGPPGVLVGAEPGDTYMDLTTGDVYKLT